MGDEYPFGYNVKARDRRIEVRPEPIPGAEYKGVDYSTPQRRSRLVRFWTWLTTSFRHERRPRYGYWID